MAEDTAKSEEDKEDELSIDFSKVTGPVKKIFKKKQEENMPSKNQEHIHHTEHSHAYHTEHSSAHHTGHHASHTENPEKDPEELSVDIKEVWRKTYHFFSKYGIVFLILIPFFFAFFLRMQPEYLPIADHWAQNNVDAYLKAQIEQEINKAYPNLPQENKNKLIDNEFAKLIASQKDMYQQQIKANADRLRSDFKDDTGQTYLLELDPYHWMRYAKNVVDHGDEGDMTKDGSPWDTHMLAPIGKTAPTLFHIRFGAYLYEFAHFFNRDITLMNIFFLLPAIFASLCTVPAFFIARKIGGNVSGFFASMMIAMNPIFLSRTVGGFSDTDSYNVFFPLVILWLFIEALYADDNKKRIAYSALAGIATGIFSYAWEGWWYVFDFIMAAIGIYCIYLLVRYGKEIFNFEKNARLKEIAVVLAPYIFISGIFVTLFRNFRWFIHSPLQPLTFLQIKEASHTTFWPNVYTTVAELNATSLSQIVDSIGGNLIVVIALLGLFSLITLKEEREKAIKLIIILLVWLAGTFYASTEGMRFVILIIPVWSILFGAGIGKMIYYRLSSAAKEIQINSAVMKVVVIVIFLIVIGFTPLPKLGNYETEGGLKMYEAFCRFGMCRSAIGISMDEVPMYTDEWSNTLQKVKENSKEDAIINSWWDFGHWFKWGADRAVTFDGASQDRPQAHWMGKALLTSDEKEAVGILRMLDCGANTGFDALNEELKNTHKSVDLLYEIIKMDAKQAGEALRKNNVPDDKISGILKKTHCEPPENFFVTSSDMVGKAGVWGHFGSWNFERAMIWGDLKNMNLEEAKRYMKDEFGYDAGIAEKYYKEIQALSTEKEANDWIAPWPSYASVGGCALRKNDSELYCDVNAGETKIRFVRNMITNDLIIENTAEKNNRPAVFAYTDNAGFHIKEHKENSFPYGLGIYQENGEYKAVLMAPELAGSMFTRLYFFGGIGLQYFDLFDKQKSTVGWDIDIWKVDWQGKDKNKAAFEDKFSQLAYSDQQ